MDTAAVGILGLGGLGLPVAANIAKSMPVIGYDPHDAPVSGLVAKAWAGALTVMAAGRDDHIARAAPIFELISSHVFTLGDRAGLGQAMKLANNVINATSFAITSEAIVFGTRAGLDLAQMLDILNVSTGRTSASLEKFPQGVLTKAPVPGAPGEIIAKDVALFLAEAHQVGTPVTVSTVVGQLWAEYVAQHPDTDSIELYRYLNERTDQ
jgi:3-hydroxyisobutyrate dehydrogenase